MATPQRIKSMITAQPFRQFTVGLVGGRSFTVQHPENAACSVDGREMTIYDDDGATLGGNADDRRRRAGAVTSGIQARGQWGVRACACSARLREHRCGWSPARRSRDALDGKCQWRRAETIRVPVSFPSRFHSPIRVPVSFPRFRCRDGRKLASRFHSPGFIPRFRFPSGCNENDPGTRRELKSNQPSVVSRL